LPGLTAVGLPPRYPRVVTTGIGTWHRCRCSMLQSYFNFLLSTPGHTVFMQIKVRCRSCQSLVSDHFFSYLWSQLYISEVNSYSCRTASNQTDSRSARPRTRRPTVSQLATSFLKLVIVHFKGPNSYRRNMQSYRYNIHHMHRVTCSAAVSNRKTQADIQQI